MIHIFLLVEAPKVRKRAQQKSPSKIICNIKFENKPELFMMALLDFCHY